MDKLGELENTLTALEKEIHLEPSSRRVMAAHLMALGWRETPHLAEHIAWLLARETDALTAYSLYQAVMVTHPERWTLTPWVRQTMRSTPFALLRTAMLDHLLTEGYINVDDEDDQALMDLLDTTVPEHRALTAEHLWLTGHDSKWSVSQVLGMLQVTAAMAEKVAAMRIVQFAFDSEFQSQATPALMALFRVEPHIGLSLKLGDILASKHRFPIDLDKLAFFIRAWHGDQIPAAETSMGTMLFGVEDFLMDRFFMGEQRQSALTQALLAYFSPTHLPADAAAVVTALAAISTNITEPFASFSATAALRETGHPNDAGRALVLATASQGADPTARALAIRVLGKQPKALLPLLDALKALVVAVDTVPKVRRAAFYALVNTRQSGLRVKTTEVIDLYFQYLREAPFSYVGDAVNRSDVAKEPAYFVAQFAESFDQIASEPARQAALDLVSKPFGFGIAEAFEPCWDPIVALMLRALDKPEHGDLHYTIFWNLLHEVVVPKPAAAVFSDGLKDRLGRIAYTERTKGLIENWLKSQKSA